MGSQWRRVGSAPQRRRRGLVERGSLWRGCSRINLHVWHSNEDHKPNTLESSISSSSTPSPTRRWPSSSESMVGGASQYLLVPTPLIASMIYWGNKPVG